MIVSSTSNAGYDVCIVHVEGVDPGTGDNEVAAFAMGAAGRHNRGFDVSSASVIWCDDRGRPLAAGVDTSEATRATVTCAVVEP